MVQSQNSRNPSDSSTFLDPALVAELKRIELRTRRSIDADLMGRYRTAFRGSGLVYSDLREYLPGDDVKNIHWKVAARTNKVYVKSYEEDRQLNILVAVDISNSTNFGAPKSKHARALEFAALISLLANKVQDSIGMCLFSDAVEEFLPPKKARSQFQQIILSLIRHRTLRPGTDLASALEYIRNHQTRPAVIFVVSDFYAPPFEAELRSLSQRNDVICVILRDSREQEMPKAGIIEFFDAEKNKRVMIDTSSKRVRRELKELQKKRIEKLRAICSSSNADCIELVDNPLKPLAQLMDTRTARIR